MYCAKCGNKLKEDSLFCSNCGCKIITSTSLKELEDESKENKTLTNNTLKEEICEPQITDDNDKEDITQHSKSKADINTTKKAKKSLKKLYIIGGSIVIIFLVCIICYFIRVNQNFDDPKAFAYVKEDLLLLHSEKLEEPLILDQNDNFVKDSIENCTNGLYYIKQNDVNDKFSLIYKDYTKAKNKKNYLGVEIDADVEPKKIQVINDTYVLFHKNNCLNVFDGEISTELKSGIIEVIPKNNLLLMISEENNLYTVDLENSGSLKQIATNVKDIYSIDNVMENIIYSINDDEYNTNNLYSAGINTNPQQIIYDANILTVPVIYNKDDLNYNNENTVLEDTYKDIYYLKRSEKTPLTLYDFIIDEYLDSDKNIEMPSIDNYKKLSSYQPSNNYGFYNYTSNANEEESYNESISKYNEMLIRNEKREYLKENSEVIFYDFYKYSHKEETLLFKNIYNVEHGKAWNNLVTLKYCQLNEDGSVEKSIHIDDIYQGGVYDYISSFYQANIDKNAFIFIENHPIYSIEWNAMSSNAPVDGYTYGINKKNELMLNYWYRGSSCTHYSKLQENVNNTLKEFPILEELTNYNFSDAISYFTIDENSYSNSYSRELESGTYIIENGNYRLYDIELPQNLNKIGSTTIQLKNSEVKELIFYKEGPNYVNEENKPFDIYVFDGNDYRILNSNVSDYVFKDNKFYFIMSKTSDNTKGELYVYDGTSTPIMIEENIKVIFN